MYEERPALAPELGGAVVWRTEAVGSGRVLPDGCMDLIWADGALLVAGPDTGPLLMESGPRVRRFAGVRFAPGDGPDVFGVPAHELTDLRVPLAALWPRRRVLELTERVAAAADPGAALEAVAAPRLRAAGPREPWRVAAVAALRAGRGVGETAARLGLSERQLRRRSLAAFGYGPKTLARVLRLQRALRLSRSGVPGAETAARAGYADQAHLAREVRALTGLPLSLLLATGHGAGAGTGEG
ncbi:helix-turn-helix domain-containing protein [Streptomyces hoynatensis]|uniref:Helix-turn-helix domain-containing protein n=1 Tax=Streptomyces hoynatensis TaxID=1141874 RepID=A0A3A9Z4K4_9ACTN|nr:helix-turn-helix domain-containing protein [Streptomyces hoynatensis]RKN43195.1 helix-turn-helix domain-containing protein [Streptomyces hoynatensis]